MTIFLTILDARFTAISNGKAQFAAMVKEIGMRWHGMSDEERVAATEGPLKELALERDMKDRGQHNVELSAFRDASATMDAIEAEVSLELGAGR